MNPELSCIIITLNEEKYLPNLLESLKAQTYQNFEVIVADYNSKDKTREIAENYRCRITEGGNYSKGRNNGVKIAKGRYLLFLDADSVMPEDFIEVNLNKFKISGKGAGTVSLKPMSSKLFDIVFFKVYDLWSIVMSRISPHCAGCGIFARKDIFDRLGGFNESVVFAENHAFVRLVKKSGHGFIILPRHMYTSVRRMDKEGRLMFILKYLYSGIYRLIYKEITNELFNYDNKRN